MIIRGSTIAKLNAPMYWYAARQLKLDAITAISCMFIALPMGRFNEFSASAKFRRFLKKFTATVRGTTPISIGFPNPRPKIYAA